MILIRALILVMIVQIQIYLASTKAPKKHNKEKESEIDINQQPQVKCTNNVCDLLDEISLRFFILGDWGGLPVAPYTTLAQRRVARAMAQIGRDEKTHFQLSVGDNLYLTGLTKSRKSNNKRLNDTFEKVYKSKAMNNPWYIIPGNHDYYGNLDEQMAYTKRSTRWAFPNHYYTIKYQIRAIRIHIITIDTVMLCGNTREGKYKNWFTYIFGSLWDRTPLGPTNTQHAKEHWNWIQEQLKESTLADYLFVAGHYPIFSVGEHGSTKCLEDTLLPLFKTYKVNAYFCGHDHNLQYLTYKFDDDWKVHNILSGSGAYVIWSRENEKRIGKATLEYAYPAGRPKNHKTAMVGRAKGGFVYAIIGQQDATFKFLLGKNKTADAVEEVYSFTITPRQK